MFCAGKTAYIVGEHGKSASVQGFSPDLPSLDLQIVDCALMHECPYTQRKVILVATGALHVPSLSHNLVHPFILREAGVKVDEQAKIHQDVPAEEHHSMYFPRLQLRVPLSLTGVFSCFPTRTPTLCELQDDSIPVVQVTPSYWDPSTDVFSRNESLMLDWQGGVVLPRDQPRVLLEDDDRALISSLHVNDCENAFMDALSDYRHTEPFEPYFCDPSCSAYSISNTLDVHAYASELDRQADLRHIASVCEVNCADIIPGPLFPDVVYSDPTSTSRRPVVSALNMKSSRGVKPEFLAKVWRIPLEVARQTVESTSQRIVRTPGSQLSRHYSTQDRALRYRRVHQIFFTDTMFAGQKIRSTRGNTCLQLFVTDKGFLFIIPMKTKGAVLQSLKAFTKAVGAPDAIVIDPSGEQTSKKVKGYLSEIGTDLRVLEAETQWANRAELYIGILKESVRRDMRESLCPLVFWDYCCERRARIINLTAGPLFQLQSRTPHESVYKEEGDISNLCQYKFYEWVYYRDTKAGFPMDKMLLGRTLGPANGEGNEMSHWILNHHGKVVPRRSHRPLTSDEITSETEKLRRQHFNDNIKSKWGDYLKPSHDGENAKNDDNDEFQQFVPYEDDPQHGGDIRAPWAIPEFSDPPSDANGTELDQQPAYDRLIHAELMLPKSGEFHPVTVLGRTLNEDGKVSGNYDDNPIFNGMTYDVRFPDGQVVEYSANVIAENLHNQVDDEGFTKTKLDCIVAHKTDDLAVHKDDMYITNRRGVKRMRKTTSGWLLKVRWHDKSEHWIPLSILKESNPVEVADYAKSKGLIKEPAFAWWVPYTLKKREVIVSAVKARTRKVTHKYGIELPSSVDNAYELDRKNGNTHWRDAICKEMRNIGVAFEVLPDGANAPPGWHRVTGHLVFDVKMSLQRKARWVLDGHKTPGVEYSTYAGVVSRETVRIALTYAALNGLDVYAADIQNAYLTAPSSRKDFIKCGSEFGLENLGRTALIRRAVYGGKSAGRDYRNHLREFMSEQLKFKSCPADPDLWMRPAITPNGEKYWEYVLVYTDDLLVISHKGEHVLRNEIGRFFKLKEDSIGPPDLYLGGQVRKVQLPDDTVAWAFGSSKYVQAAVKNVQEYLMKTGEKLRSRADTPLSSGYRPEIDVSPELKPKEASHFQSLVGILRWIVELGRVDIACEVSMMSSHLALPREGHLQQLYNIFAYLKKHHNAEMVFDPTVPDVNRSHFQRRDWSTSEAAFSGKEVLPPNRPEMRGLGFLMRAFVDADHATDSMTRRSRTGFLIYLNKAPIYWRSAKQTAVETSSFGSEFTAMKACCEYIRGLRYKLRMMGIPMEEPTYVYGDNQSVLANTSNPDSQLKKKSLSIAYHFVREGCARDEWRTTYINTHFNLSDLLTKSLPSGEKRKSFVRMILHHIYPLSSR